MEEVEKKRNMYKAGGSVGRNLGSRQRTEISKSGDLALLSSFIE
jgi:hypothetical protein